MNTSKAPITRPIPQGDQSGGHPPERRAAVRFEPEPWVPVFFHSPAATEPSVGYVADVSATGLRVVAPPTTRPNLWWGDVVRIEVARSTGTALRGIDGTVLLARVARISVDVNGMSLGVALERPIDPTPWMGPLPSRMSD